MTEYVVPKRNVDETDPTDITWGWHSAAVPAGMTGFKVTVSATGSGEIQFDIIIENPETSSGPAEDWWTADPGVTSMNFNNSFETFVVSGASTFEHTFYQPGDPWFSGFTYVDPIDNITKSLHANETTGFDFFIYGRLRCSVGVTVTGYELILFGPGGIPTRRKTHRNDRTRRGAGISSRQRSTRRAGGYV